MPYLLGIDIGTSGTKTVLFREDGEVVASHTREYPLSQPRNGWAAGSTRLVGGCQRGLRRRARPQRR